MRSNIVLDGERLSGKTTVSSVLCALDKGSTLIEGRIVANLRSQFDRGRIETYYTKIASLMNDRLGWFILVRGPFSALMEGKTESVERAISQAMLFDQGATLFVLMDMSYDTYVSRFSRYVRHKDILPWPQNVFDSRRRIMLRAAQSFSGNVAVIGVDDEDYSQAAKEVVRRAQQLA